MYMFFNIGPRLLNWDSIGTLAAMEFDDRLAFEISDIYRMTEKEKKSKKNIKRIDVVFTVSNEKNKLYAINDIHIAEVFELPFADSWTRKGWIIVNSKKEFNEYLNNIIPAKVMEKVESRKINFGRGWKYEDYKREPPHFYGPISIDSIELFEDKFRFVIDKYTESVSIPVNFAQGVLYL